MLAIPDTVLSSAASADDPQHCLKNAILTSSAELGSGHTRCSCTEHQQSLSQWFRSAKRVTAVPSTVDSA